LPNLFLRSTLTLALLFGVLTLVLITLVQLRYLGPGLALAIGVGIAVVQFILSPYILDLFLGWLSSCRWVKPEELPEHLRLFVQRVTAEQKIRFPHFGIIDDGAPTAFTYGHHPNNGRVVISRGLMELLEPAEVEAVVAHELGHVRNWDMALMTIAQIVPLLLYFLYRVTLDRGGKDKPYAWAVAIGAYVLYIVSEYIVLMFSRTREYFADRFAGEATGNPNALASALVKIAYGLAAQAPAVEATDDEEAAEAAKDKKEKATPRTSVGEMMGAFNIFDKKAAVAMVMASAPPKGMNTGKLDPEQVKGAMQWDLWNPWAAFHELHSTHPLVAKRLQRLGDQAAHQGQEPFIIFDRRQPESYWDEFAVDLSVAFLPILGWLVGIGGFTAQLVTTATFGWWWLAAGLALACLGSLAKTAFAYRRDFFPHLSVTALLHKVKVSDVRPVPTTLTGTIIGKGVPGLIYSEDFVLRDHTGILFLDYRQPLALWNFLFGLLKAGDYQGKEVRVSGWFRRAPVPYLEVNQIEVLDGTLPARRCYTLHARLIFGVLGAVVGVAAALFLLMR
jgi:Zn-dependent protease with chaperone function